MDVGRRWQGNPHSSGDGQPTLFGDTETEQNEEGCREDEKGLWALLLHPSPKGN